MSIKWMITGAALCVALGAWAVASRRTEETPLPPAMSQALTRHAAERVSDSVQVAAWRAAADSAATRERAALARASRAEDAARRDSARAAALEGAQKIPLAYAAKVAEVLTLRVMVADVDSAVHASDVRAAVLDSGLARTSKLAATGDSLVSAAVRVAEAREPPCRIAGVFACPPRKAVAVGAAVVGFAFARGWLAGAIGVVSHLL